MIKLCTSDGNRGLRPASGYPLMMMIMLHMACVMVTYIYDYILCLYLSLYGLYLILSITDI